MARLEVRSSENLEPLTSNPRVSPVSLHIHMLSRRTVMNNAGQDVHLGTVMDLRTLGLEVLRDADLNQGIRARREHMGHVNPQERIGKERWHDAYPGPHVHGYPPVTKFPLVGE